MAELRVRYPAYGTVRTLLGYALLALVVGHATEAFVETLRVVAPGVDSTLLSTAMAAVLWVALGLVLLAELRRQADSRSPTFVASEEVVAFLDQRRLSAREWALWAVATLVGGAAVWAARDIFFATLDDALLVGRRLAETGEIGHFSPVNLALGVAFLVGFALLAAGLDRLLVGAAREVQHRRATG